MCTAYYTLRSTQYMQCLGQCQYTVHTTQYTLHSSWASASTQYTLRSRQYTVPGPVPVHSAWAGASTQCLGQCQYTVHTTQYTVHSAWARASTQYTLRSTQYTVPGPVPVLPWSFVGGDPCMTLFPFDIPRISFNILPHSRFQWLSIVNLQLLLATHLLSCSLKCQNTKEQPTSLWMLKGSVSRDILINLVWLGNQTHPGFNFVKTFQVC